MKASWILQTCDACNNGITIARYRNVLPSGQDLVFCGHHQRQHGLDLALLGAKATELVNEDGARLLDAPTEPIGAK